MQSYYSIVDGVVQAFGGGLVTAPMSVVFELQIRSSFPNTPATGNFMTVQGVTSSPASCQALRRSNSVQLIGSDGILQGDTDGSACGLSTLPSGVKMDSADWCCRGRRRLQGICYRIRVTFLARVVFRSLVNL